MVDDFEYFAEFLRNPSAPDLNEFFRILRRWARYIEAHKAEFDYLEDDQWKEIRERLIDELEVRVDAKDDLEVEWVEINEAIGKLPEGGGEKGLALFRRRLDFMKSYCCVFDIAGADISEFEQEVTDFAKALERAKIAETELQLQKLALAGLIADLDDELVGYYEKTGKIPVLPNYRDKKTYKGN